jgi:hypothetical protein
MTRADSLHFNQRTVKKESHETEDDTGTYWWYLYLLQFFHLPAIQYTRPFQIMGILIHRYISFYIHYQYHSQFDLLTLSLSLSLSIISRE